MMILGTDATNRVLLVIVGGDVDSMPEVFNGAAIFAHILTKAQEDEYNGLPSDRGGTLFDGDAFDALPAPAAPAPAAISKADMQAQIAALKAKVDALP